MGKLNFGTTGLAYEVAKPNQGMFGGAPACPRCKKSVYFNEEKRENGKVWHIACFCCAKCKKRLDSTNQVTHENEIYCDSCHKREFGPRGYGFAGGMSGLSTESTIHHVRPVSQIQTQAVPSHIKSSSIDYEDLESCPRCGKRVYFAEEVKALSRKYHRLCFKCIDCSKMIEPGNFSAHEKMLFCQSCYSRKHGTKGYGFAGGAGTLLSSEPQKFVRSPIRKEYTPASSTGSQEWTEAVFI